ncbi:MAG: HAMP domain-containing histidine kinase, partial [Ardenticatenaceae bacterium]|nr:HAMP domain-containing histidine kinase [Ardenticatenaceae bacterium]
QKVAERTQELRQAYAQLERMDQTKSDFITIASHELRTPLTILNVHNQILLFDETIQADPELLKRVNGIQSGASRMEEVVEAMLDVAKIDSQSLTLQLAPLNLPVLIRMVAQKFRAALDQRTLTLDIAPMRDLPEIEADSGALEKVFYHLIINAIKYTPDGGRIWVEGRPLQEPNRPPSVTVSVADQGIGIAPDVQEMIFEKFYQTGEVMLHSSGKTTFKGGGSGLGLAIARGIVGAHNGRIWVESPGHDEKACPGSTFHLVLPVRQDS